MKFKILHTEASLGWGGQEIRIFQEATEMRKRGHNFIIAAQPESRLIGYAKKEGFKTISIKFKRRNFINIILFFKKLIEKEKIDIVNTHSSKDSWLVLPAARTARNKPLTLRTRHLSTKIHGGILNRLLYNRLPRFVITTGEAIRRQMIEVNGFNADKIISIPTGVDMNAFNLQSVYRDLRKELSLAQETPLVGMVSVLRSWKGHVYFIRAIPYVISKKQNVRFVIVGEGPYRSTIEKVVDEVNAGKYIYFLNHRDDIPAIMSSLDILVHPSYGNEGVPQSVLQAMAMQKPVLVSDLPSLKEVINDRTTGLIMPVNDPETMASKILYLLDNKENTEKMSENARRLIKERYSLEGMLDRIEALYRKVLNVQ